MHPGKPRYTWRKRRLGQVITGSAQPPDFTPKCYDSAKMRTARPVHTKGPLNRALSKPTMVPWLISISWNVYFFKILIWTTNKFYSSGLTLSSVIVIKYHDENEAQKKICPDVSFPYFTQFLLFQYICKMNQSLRVKI